jgi:enoyl-CoA hydratase/carnithine racemase
MATIEYSCEPPVATIWLNRPDARNAFDVDMMRGLRRAVARAERDTRVRAVVVRGRGDCFSVGGDIRMLEGDPQRVGSGHSWLELAQFMVESMDRLSEGRKITIAAVHGFAIAGGFELMLACDFAVATEDAKIGDFHIRNGLFGSAGPIYRLPRMIGIRKAKELILSGDVLSGVEARDLGLVNVVAPAAELDAAVAKFAARFTDKSPTITWLTKMAVSRGMDGDPQTLKVLESMAAGVVAASDDAREGLAALSAGRKPNWPVLEGGPEFEESEPVGD